MLINCLNSLSRRKYRFQCLVMVYHMLEKSVDFFRSFRRPLLYFVEVPSLNNLSNDFSASDVYYISKDFHLGNWSPSYGVLNFWVMLTYLSNHGTIIPTGITCNKILLYNSIEFGMALK